MSKIYTNRNVLEEALERYAFVFDNFEDVFVSVSGGKDSTVLYYLALAEAVKRGRKINVFFLDQEAEYQSTIDVMRPAMSHPNVIPFWYQVPIYMTNATSYQQDMLYAWGPGEEWIRPKEPNSIHEISGIYPKRFYKFFDWFEKQQTDGSAFLVGIRAEESLNRFRAVTKKCGYPGILWSTKAKNDKSYRFYPLFDWGSGDIWKYIADSSIPYNAIYDKMFANNHSIYGTMRVSNLIHEKSFSCLTDLQILEPETYDKVIKRISGTHCAALYAKDHFIYSSDKLPESFASWKSYRDYLLETTPYKNKERFIKRFNGQPQTEYVFRQQCKQLLINDWENNISVTPKSNSSAVMEKWRKIL